MNEIERLRFEKDIGGRLYPYSDSSGQTVKTWRCMFHNDYHNCEPLLCNRELDCPIHQIMDWADEINERTWENDESQRITMCDMDNLDNIILKIDPEEYNSSSTTKNGDGV